jgi:hypothetical protein
MASCRAALIAAGAFALLGAGACSGGGGAGKSGGAGGSTAGTGTAGSGGRGGAAGGSAGSGSAGSGVAGSGAAGSGPPSAAELLAKVDACASTAVAVKGGFGLDGAGSISIYQCAGALYWKADMDVDCDGIQTPPCDTDVTGQPQTSIVDLAPTGDVDPTKLPYFVIPLGTPETTWYKSYDVQLGQVGAVIYKGRVEYGIFADEAGGAFIGESSYAMCQLFLSTLGAPSGSTDPCDPNQGGIDPADITYVTFTGAANRVRGADIYDHAKQATLGGTAARAWVGAP